jgi:hypothetical protein
MNPSTKFLFQPEFFSCEKILVKKILPGFFWAYNLFVPEIFAVQTFFARFFSRSIFFKPEIFDRKNFCGRKFSRLSFSQEPEITISPRNPKKVPFWDF